MPAAGKPAARIQLTLRNHAPRRLRGSVVARITNLAIAPSSSASTCWLPTLILGRSARLQGSEVVGAVSLIASARAARSSRAYREPRNFCGVPPISEMRQPTPISARCRGTGKRYSRGLLARARRRPCGHGTSPGVNRRTVYKPVSLRKEGGAAAAPI